MTWCWACDAPVDVDASCAECGAPWWAAAVVTATHPANGGVYVVRDSCGMVKIGVTVAFAGRLRELGSDLELLCTLPGAGRDVERWLHQRFADVRDRSGAEAEYLPNPTEWFWPTPALYALVAGEPFATEVGV